MLYWIHYIKLIGVSDMICYKIEESFEECKSCEGYTGDTVVVVSDKELKEIEGLVGLGKDNIPNYKNAQCCRAKVHPSLISACFSAVSKDKKMTRSNFGFIIQQCNFYR